MANELDALDPQPMTVTLSTGTEIELERLRARQFFKLLRVITRGALPNMQDFSVFRADAGLDPGEWAGRLLTLILLSIPEAEDEAIAFVQSMVRPVGLVERRHGQKLNKLDTERNTELWTKVITDLDNPELDDLATIIEAVVRREAEDIQALGKRLAGMFRLAEKTGQAPSGLQSPTSQDSNGSADSRGRSTFSPPSTGGSVNTLQTSPSAPSDSTSPLSGSDSTTASGATIRL